MVVMEVRGGDNAIETVGKWITAERLGRQRPKETITGGKRSRAAFRDANLAPERSISSYFSPKPVQIWRVRVYQRGRYSRPSFPGLAGGARRATSYTCHFPPLVISNANLIPCQSSPSASRSFSAFSDFY